MTFTDFLRRPIVARYHIGAWLVLLATLPLGLRAYADNPRIGLTTWEPGWMMGINYHTYHYAAELALAGEAFYHVAPPGTFDWATYLYPPGTVVAFYPFTLLEWSTGFTILTVLSVLASLGATVVIVDYAEYHGAVLGWVDISLIMAAFVFSTHAFGTVFFGNINLLLAFAIALGLWLLLTDRELFAGVLFGLAALFKLFPVVIGLWLLRGRYWRGVLAATLTGVAGILGGIALFGFETTRYYVLEVARGRAGSQLFVGGYPVDGTYYITIQQPLSHHLWTLWPSAPYEAVLVLGIAVCAVLLAYFYIDLTTDLDRIMAIFVTLVVMIVIFPALRWYLVMLYLPMIVLLYTWKGEPGRWLFLAGGVVFSITYSTGDVVEWLAWLPGPLSDVWFLIGGYAQPPLYGIGMMVVACMWYRHRRTRPIDRTLPARFKAAGWASIDELRHVLAS